MLLDKSTHFRNTKFGSILIIAQDGQIPYLINKSE